MPGLIAENPVTHCGSQEGSSSPGEAMSLDATSQSNPPLSEKFNAARSGNGEEATLMLVDVAEQDRYDEELAVHNGVQITEDPALPSIGGGEASSMSPNAGRSEELVLEQTASYHGHEGDNEEDKLPHPNALNNSLVRGSKDESRHNTRSSSVKPIVKKKPTSLSIQKEAEKEKLQSPKATLNKHRNAGKERTASAKLTSPVGVPSSKLKDSDKGTVDSLKLPLPVVASKAEKEKIMHSPGAHASPGERSKDQSNAHEKVKEKTKTQNKQHQNVVVKSPENCDPPENGKRPFSAKEKEKLSPGSPISPSRSSVKVSTGSPLRPLRITPPPALSEKVLNSAGKTPTGKLASHDMELSKLSPKSPASGNKLADKSLSSEKVTPDQQKTSPNGEKVYQKINAYAQRRKSGLGMGSRKFGDSESVVSSEQACVLTRDNPNLGPFLLKLARQAIISGDNPKKALDYASRATKSYESAADGRPSLDLVMSLHILAATHCTLGQFEEAIPVLQHSLEATDIEGGGQDHALAGFAGNMQLGDTYSLLGRGEDALAAYHIGLEVQKKALGDMDPHVGETCRYLAEAHTQAMQFDKAQELCQHALNIHKEHSAPASIEEATDRRLMGLICNGKGEHEAALEHLVLASMALIANGKDVDVAAVDTSIGDTYISLGRYDEAVFAYQKALTVFKASKGESHVSVASVYVSLAELYLKTGKYRECKTYCDSALRIYNKQGAGHPLDELASGLTELAVVYEALNEQDQALSLLKKALGILDAAPGQQSAMAGVEAQIGVLSYMCGNYMDAHSSLSRAVSKLRASAEKSSALFGILLNQMGLCCLHLSEIQMAAALFEESRSVLDAACGPHHPDTLTVYSNLAGAYDALGRLDDAITALQHVIEVREEELGTANSEVDEERSRLAELLKEAGCLRARRLNNTLALLMQPKLKLPGLAGPVKVSVNG